MKKFSLSIVFFGSMLLVGNTIENKAMAAGTMSLPNVSFAKEDVILVHCCHAHSVHPYDSYCCHPPGAYVVRGAVAGAAAYGVYRGVKHAHKKHHKKHHAKPARRRR